MSSQTRSLVIHKTFHLQIVRCFWENWTFIFCLQYFKKLYDFWWYMGKGPFPHKICDFFITRVPPYCVEAIERFILPRPFSLILTKFIKALHNAWGKLLKLSHHLKSNKLLDSISAQVKHKLMRHGDLLQRFNLKKILQGQSVSQICQISQNTVS